MNAAFVAVLIWVMLAEGHAYLDVWAQRPETAQAFTASLVSLSYSIRSVPESTPKYVVIQSSGAASPQVDPWDSGGRTENLPIALQTVMFLTDSYLPEQQREKNIHYVLMQDKATVPADALTAYITLQ